MITFERLTKRYRSKLAVDSITGSIAPGRVTGFLGPNGAGKSTTLRLMVGLDRPTSGEARINGTNYITRSAPMLDVGIMLDSAGALGSRRCVDHLRWLAYSNRIPSSRISECLTQCGISQLARKRTSRLSLGMSQRLGIAAALLGDPQILILDEPSNGLDAEGIVWIRNLLKALAAEGRTVLVSSHLMGEMAETAQHVLVMGHGQILADCPTAKLPIVAGLPTSVFVRSPRAQSLASELASLGMAAIHERPDAVTIMGEDATRIAKHAASWGIPLTELTEREPTLEQAYLELTSRVTDYAGAPVTQ